MWQVALLVLVCVLYVYVIERRARHFVQNQNMNPFDEKLLSKLVFVANFFKHKAIWSNIILVLGSVVSLMLFLLGIYLNEDGTLLVAFSLWSSFATISISASFEGTTWVKKVNVWVNSLSHSLAMRIIKTLTFELLSIIYLVLPFLFFYIYDIVLVCKWF